MSPRFFIALFLLSAFTPLPAQELSQPERFQVAKEQWDEGHFVEALEVLEALLAEGVPEPLQDRIAALTGEVFHVTELATDGRAVRWSPDGRHAAFESGTDSDARTHIFSYASSGLRPMGPVTGAGLAFSTQGGSAAFLSLPETEALAEARTRLEEEFAGGDRASRMQLRAAQAALNARHSVVSVVNLETGEDEVVPTPDMAVFSVFFGPDGALHLVGAREGDLEGSHVYRREESGDFIRITETGGSITDPIFLGENGGFLAYGIDREIFGILEVATGELRSFRGSSPSSSSDGKTLAYLVDEGGEGVLRVLSLTSGGVRESEGPRIPYPVSVSSSRSCSACPQVSGLALSPAGDFAVVQARPREDWELFVVPLGSSAGDSGIEQVTREIQHDLYPMVLPGGRLLAMKGEGRHRRAHLYDLESGEIIWLFRNNTTRTVAPEYEWAPSPDGTKLLIVAERDGNTVSPERGVYLMDLTRKVGGEQLLARVQRNLRSERDLRARAEAMYAPVAGKIRELLEGVSTSRIFEYEEALYSFGSKNVSQPGNREAIHYIAQKLRDFGYEPELQWFDARGVESANVIARIPGSVSPDVVYTVSAHFDSNTRSPGADDNTSATVGLLEMARVLSGHALPATIEIALFTGEESGLLGSREYVRLAVESGKNIVGALNNDMVGYAEDHRLDNTIRYSNKGIRDLQHGAAILFSDMVTHDAEYYKSTDAAAYYDAYGDIVGGIGSYPILASPHYHQSHDVLETINHQLVTEVSKVTAASVILMASSPSRLTGLNASRRGGAVELSWDPAVESDVTSYTVAYGPEEDPFETHVTVSDAGVTLEGVAPGTTISVVAVNKEGLKGWDWARIEVED